MSYNYFSFSTFASYYSNNLFPENAVLLRKLISINEEPIQQKRNILCVTIPRIFRGLLTIPAALIDSARICVVGNQKFFIELYDGNFQNAMHIACTVVKESLLCLAAAIASIACTVLSLVFGTAIFKEFKLKPLPPSLEEKNTLLQDELKAKEIAILNQQELIKKQEQTYEDGWKTIRELYAEKLTSLELEYRRKKIVSEEDQIQRNQFLDLSHEKRTLELQTKYEVLQENLEILYQERIQELEYEYREKTIELEKVYDQVMLEILKRGLECIYQNESVMQLSKSRDSSSSSTPKSVPRSLPRSRGHALTIASSSISPYKTPTKNLPQDKQSS